MSRKDTRKSLALRLPPTLWRALPVRPGRSRADAVRRRLCAGLREGAFGPECAPGQDAVLDVQLPAPCRAMLEALARAHGLAPEAAALRVLAAVRDVPTAPRP